MDTTAILSENLKGLIDATTGLTEHSLSILADVPKTTIRRMRLDEGAAQIDSVEKVAKAFKLRACDILDPDLLKRLAAGEPLRMGEPRPPVMPDETWRAMSPRARALVEDLCTRTLAGQLQEGDIAWLHDSLQRINPPAQSTPVADMVLKAKPITRTTDLINKAADKS
jgi:hypothetical protein